MNAHIKVETTAKLLHGARAIWETAQKVFFIVAVLAIGTFFVVAMLGALSERSIN